MKLVRRTLLTLSLALALALSNLVPAFAIPQLLVDMRTGEVLFENEAGVPWHPASLTKLMTALLAFEAIQSGQISLSTPVITSANALSVPPSKLGLPEGTAMTMQDALYALIVKSANDIAVAIAETVGGTEERFVQMMNARAAEMGMTATHYVNPHGLHDPAQVTSARDLAILALTIRARYPQYDAIFSTESVTHGGARMESNNILLSKFLGTDGMKTGYVCASGLNIVATAARNGRHLMAITLGASSARERGEMTAQMLFSGFAGGYRGTGTSIVALTNSAGLAPVDMRPLICGANAPDYNEARMEEFPLGLDGELSYLTDDLTPPSYSLAVLGRLRNVPLPRPRPSGMPAAPTYAAGGFDETLEPDRKFGG
ncbi:D-alanyl-D-alanine carboxypeptidase family protein [Pelagibacterium halotolerans]|uniref:D-alanyl-D-alanine carboxypeptidase family protein n=1 Tax=Pelagibacterium halotolerans TaxID=531813 RepID=UPI003851314C